VSLLVDIEKDLGSFFLQVRFESEGGVLGLLGPSGSGKSMTLKCIAGIERPDRGRIVLDGETLFDSEKRIDLPPQRRRVGYLFQSYALFPNMTVAQNILCGLCREPDRDKKKALLQEAVAMMRLEGLEQLRPAQLSGGQAQRAALARILVSRPNLLMLDELFSALDSHLRDQLQLQTKALLAQFGKPVLLVTHSRDEAYHLCSQIAVVDQGRFLALKETKALFADPGSVQAARLTGCKNIAKAKKTGDYELEVPAWGVRLRTALPVADGVRAVGIRAHYFNSRATQNRYPIRFTGEMEEPFEVILQFRYEGQDPAAPDLWWRIPKDRRPQALPEAFGVAPANVLPLYI